MKKPRRSARLLKGSCLCGAVAFSVRDEFTYALNCHCSQCRRTTGAAYKPFGGIPKTKFRLERGTRSLLIYGDAEGYNAHCKVCGSPLYAVVRAGKYVHVKEVRLAEWPVAFLSRPRRTPRTIPDFMAADAPPNRLEILRGTAK